MATFTVMAIVREEPAVIRRFLAQCRRIGASRVIIHYDGDLVELVAQGFDPAAEPGVTFVPMDEAYWRRIGRERPPIFSDAQRMILGQAFAALEDDWMLLCDADEFVIDRIPVPDFLDAIPAGVDSVAIRPVEAVWGPGEDIREPFGSTWFRRTIGGRKVVAMGLSTLFYGALGPLFQRGILSHVLGKQFLRRGAAFDLVNVHNASRDGRIVTVFADRIEPRLGAVELAHFDALSYDRWLSKFGAMAAQPDDRLVRKAGARRRQIARFRAAQARGPEATERLCRALYQPGNLRLRLLRRLGLAFQARLFD